jgi:type IV pilus assembly protein PilW
MKQGLQTGTIASLVRQAGLSLVELMISITIGLILLAALATLIAEQSATRNELEKSSRQIENGRYAIELLGNDIEHAGFYSEYAPPKTTVYSMPDPCVPDNAGWIPSPPEVPVGLYGYAGAAADPTLSACLPNYKANTAVLAVRRTSTDAPIAASAAVAGTTYMQVSRCNQDTAPFVMAASGFSLKQKDCLTLGGLRKYIVRIYYLSTCNECGTGGDGVPTLKVVEFADGATTVRPLVEGIENMQFDYGVDTTGGGAPDSYTTAPAAGQWKDIMAVRVNLLARNIDKTSGYTDTKSYGLSAVTGGVTVPASNDNYKRHAYNQVVRVINPSSRREVP